MRIAARMSGRERRWKMRKDIDRARVVTSTLGSCSAAEGAIVDAPLFVFAPMNRLQNFGCDRQPRSRL